MPILGRLLKQGIKLRKTIEQERKTAFQLQKKQLFQLLNLARRTHFGQYYDFDAILQSFSNSPSDSRQFYETFKKIPHFNYKRIYDQWWQRAQDGEKDVSWRGKVEYFALSSGTAEAASKYIPITRDMIRAIQRTSIRQILSLSNYKELPSHVYTKRILMLGGSTHLNRRGTYFEGDLSGITASQIPFWFQHHYKPGRKISRNRDWDDKLEEIAQKAPKWDIGFIVGVPAWIQIMLENIIDRYSLEHIHEIWPNLMLYTHGGVSFEPYKKGFEKLLGKPISYIETYLASEGFIAFQTHPGQDMRLVLNNGIFLEFVPFNSQNFSPDGEMKEKVEAYMIDETLPNQDYAILLTTCAGAWRYLIGDVIRFTNLEKNEIIISGRTKHFLSLCGEHLSVDNMNKAIEMVSHEMNIHVKEFTVTGIPYDSLFAHQWYIGSDDIVNENILRDKLDIVLRNLNDDYRVERSAALKEIFVKVLPSNLFYKWLEVKGKLGAQNKFPRVLKTELHQDWLSFIHQKSI